MDELSVPGLDDVVDELSASDNLSYEGDTVGSLTEEELERGDMTAIEARRSARAQPSRMLANDPPARVAICSRMTPQPAMIIVLCEATDEVAEMQMRQTRPAPDGNVAMRDWCEHHVFIGQDADAPILMAARKDNCLKMECHDCKPWVDGRFRTNGKSMTASTKVMVCTFHWKENIGHLGDKITVMGVHGHRHTMNMNVQKNNYR